MKPGLGGGGGELGADPSCMTGPVQTPSLICTANESSLTFGSICFPIGAPVISSREFFFYPS